MKDNAVTGNTEKKVKKPRISKDEAPSQQDAARSDYRRSFPVIGLGGSAGGLEAFEAFFKNLPEAVDASFVAISHLDPRHINTAKPNTRK